MRTLNTLKALHDYEQALLKHKDALAKNDPFSNHWYEPRPCDFELSGPDLVHAESVRRRVLGTR